MVPIAAQKVKALVRCYQVASILYIFVFGLLILQRNILFCGLGSIYSSKFARVEALYLRTELLGLADRSLTSLQVKCSFRSHGVATDVAVASGSS